MALKIFPVQALHGDCFVLHEEDSGIRFIIDCGPKITYGTQIKNISTNFDFIIITHIDEDHIHGAIAFAEELGINCHVKKVYVNSPNLIVSGKRSGKISVRQGVSLEKILKDKQVEICHLQADETIKFDNVEDFWIDVLCPSPDILSKLSSFYETKTEHSEDINISAFQEKFSSISELAGKKDSFKNPDLDILNSSSIVLIVNYKGKKVLFTGDGHPELICDALERRGYSREKKITFDYVKLPHHGSKYNISERFISIIRCSNFIVSTNGGKGKSKHPDRETIAKVVVNCERAESKNMCFLFNYPLETIEMKNGKLLLDDEKEFHNVVFSNCKEVEL
jgi:beta-lactamase superfamily II metal-dependent hydrolase